MKITAGELATMVGGRVEDGQSDVLITGIASAADAGEGDLTFFGNKKYLHAIRQSKATVVLVPTNFDEELHGTRIFVDNPSATFAEFAPNFMPKPVVYAPGVHPSAVVADDVELGEGVSVQPNAVISPGAKIGARTVIGANVFIGEGTELGEDCLIYPLVSVRERVLIGNRVVIQSGAVIGADGYGFEYVDGRHMKVPQIGIVQIDDDVEIGAGSCVDRARFGRTWLGEGTKLDNLVQVAHNVVVGKHCLIVAQTAIGGSTKLCDHVTVAGQTGVAGHIEVGEGTLVGGRTGVNSSVGPGRKVYGTPAIDMREWQRRQITLGRVPRLIETVKALETQVAELSKALKTDDSSDE